MSTIRELRNEAAGLKVEGESIFAKADAEKRSLTDQEAARIDEINARRNEISTDIKRREALGVGAGEPGAPVAGAKEAPSDPDLGMSSKDVRNYSILRAVRAAVSGNWNEAKLEKDASDAVQKKVGREPRSFFIPYDVINPREKRDMTVGTPSAGGYLKSTDLVPSLIELLSNKLVLGQAGVSMLTGLVGDVAIPKQTGGATGYWLAENGAPTEAALTLGQVSLTPHTFGAYVDISRKLMKQSSISVETLVRNDIARTIALGIDYAGLHGNSGSDANQPDGIAVTSGIGSVVGGTNGAAPDWADIVDLETNVSQDNADMGSLAYVTNSKVRGKLKKTMRTATYGEIPIWGEGNTPLNGYPAYVTNQVSSTLSKGSSNVASAIFFGNWADLVLGMWGEMDMLVDPYTFSSSGAVRIVAFQDVDFAVRHAESFAAMLDALTA